VKTRKSHKEKKKNWEHTPHNQNLDKQILCGCKEHTDAPSRRKVDGKRNWRYSSLWRKMQTAINWGIRLALASEWYLCPGARDDAGSGMWLLPAQHGNNGNHLSSRPFPSRTNYFTSLTWSTLPVFPLALGGDYRSKFSRNYFVQITYTTPKRVKWCDSQGSWCGIINVNIGTTTLYEFLSNFIFEYSVSLFKIS